MKGPRKGKRKGYQEKDWERAIAKRKKHLAYAHAPNQNVVHFCHLSSENLSF